MIEGDYVIIIDTNKDSRGWLAELYNEDDKLLSWAIEPEKETAVIHATLLFIQKCTEYREEAIQKMIDELKTN